MHIYNLQSPAHHSYCQTGAQVAGIVCQCDIKLEAHLRATAKGRQASVLITCLIFLQENEESIMKN